MNLNYENQTTMTYADFNAIAKQEDKKLGSKSISELEDTFWATVHQPGSAKQYSIDNNTSLFSKKCKFWNLNQFTASESLIHGHGEDMAGITTPYVYAGSPLTAFGMHKEDADLNSISYNHKGGIKFW